MDEEDLTEDTTPEFAELRYENPIMDVLFAEDTEPDWLIPRMIPQGTLVLLAGEPGAGKSYISYTIGLAIASGWSALSGIVPEGRPRRVLYFDEENSEPDRNKYLSRSWWGLVDNKGKPPDVKRLHEHFWPVHFRLGDDRWFETAEMFVRYFQPELIVFDTAASAFNIQDENSNAEAGQVIRQVKTLMRMVTPTAACIVLKHARVTYADKGKTKRTIRGATIWKSLADQTMFQVRTQGRPRKGGLQLTRLEGDKGRAYALESTIYITPSWTDEDKTGLLLEASYHPSKEHERRQKREDGDEDE